MTSRATFFSGTEGAGQVPAMSARAGDHDAMHKSSVNRFCVKRYCVLAYGRGAGDNYCQIRLLARRAEGMRLDAKHAYDRQ